MTSLIEQLNNSAFDFYFLVVDQFLDINLSELPNFYSLSPEKFGITLDTKNSGKLLSHPKIIEFITRNSAITGHKPAIIPFKPSAKIDLICQQHSWILVSNPASLNRLIEDKIKFYDLCTKNNLSVIPSLILPFNQENYQLAADKFKTVLVLQTHFGWAGNSSHVSQNWEDIKNAIPSGSVVKFSPFLEGYSLINNCCITRNGLVQSPPGLQYTGIKPLTNNPLATVGRQWPAQIPPEIYSQVKKITQQFTSEIITPLNYRGFFGLDFLVSQDKVYLIECNARLTASFAFYTELEKQAGLTPLFFLHLAEFIDLNYSEADHFDANLVGSEVTAKNQSGATIKKYSDFTSFSASSSSIKINPEIIAQVI